MLRNFDSMVGLVLNYNSYADLHNLLHQINQFHTCFKIVVADNHSNDNSIEKVKALVQLFDFVELIEIEDNRGYAAGNNAGFKYINEKYNPEFVLVMNPDIVFEELILDRFFEEIIRDSKIAITGGKMLDEHGRELLSAWKLPTLLDNIIITISFIHKILGTPIEYKEVQAVQNVEVVQGALFLARLEALKAVDYFSEKTFLYMEESILGLKLKHQNFVNRYLSDVSFVHKVGGSIDQVYSGVARKYRLLTSSRRIYHKYYRGDHVIGLLLFDFFAFIGLIEKVIAEFLMKLIAKK